MASLVTRARKEIEQKNKRIKSLQSKKKEDEAILEATAAASGYAGVALAALVDEFFADDDTSPATFGDTAFPVTPSVGTVMAVIGAVMPRKYSMARALVGFTGLGMTYGPTYNFIRRNLDI